MSAPHPADPDAYRHQPPSLYVVPAFYDWLVQVSADLASSAPRAPDAVEPARAQGIATLLATEARLLDQAALDAQALAHWLALYHEHCAYWIPATQPAGDPRDTITLEFHDRRRLLDRVARLATGQAYSQLPASRTARTISGLELWPSPDRDDEWRARCTFLLAESREGRGRLLAGWNGFVLRRAGDALRIVLKQINLIDCDGAQGNNSFFL